jgi:putative ABC transport system ATP-binding protein
VFGTARSVRQRRVRAQELLTDLDLDEYEDRFPNELSGGERQRVAIARALANQPNVLLADDPTGSLDSRSTSRFPAILDDLGAQGITIIMVTHSSEVAAHADQIVKMSDGRIA